MPSSEALVESDEQAVSLNGGNGLIVSAVLDIHPPDVPARHLRAV